MSCDANTGRIPLGIDIRSPRLSWVIQSDRRGEIQTAYQVLVASSPDLLRQDKGDLWDSGKVEFGSINTDRVLGKTARIPSTSLLEGQSLGREGRDGCFQRTGLLVHGLFEPGRVEGEVDRTR